MTEWFKAGQGQGTGFFSAHSAWMTDNPKAASADENKKPDEGIPIFYENWDPVIRTPTNQSDRCEDRQINR
jgi:hypothetical protein